MTLLGFLRIGSIWEGGICRRVVGFETREFDIDFDADGWELTSFYEVSRRASERPFPLDIYPLKYDKDRNSLLSFSVSLDGRLIIPCIELFSRCYGQSQEVKRVLTAYRWREPSDPHSPFHPNIRIPESESDWHVSLNKRYKFVNADARFLAWLKYNEHTQFCAKSIYAQMEKAVKGYGYDEKGSIVHLSVLPWHDQKVRIRVQGIPFNNGRSFLALRIVGCSAPAGPNIKLMSLRSDGRLEVTWDRDRNDALLKRKARSGRYAESKLPITSDYDPDWSAPRRVLRDHKLVELSHPDRDVVPVEDVKVGLGTTTRPASRNWEKSDQAAEKYSTGDRYGDRDGVGEAALSSRLEQESKGILLDMWESFVHLKRRFPNKINRVDWFTFEKGFRDSGAPQLIKLKKLPRYKKVKGEVRKWPYLNEGGLTLRGALVIRVVTEDKTIYVVEIQRRLERVKGAPSEWKEESMSGLCFSVSNYNEFERWLKTVLSKVRYELGVFKRIAEQCPGDADWFVHVRTEAESIPYEPTARNALKKMGVKL
ncbi:MAG: hypothetical protein HLX50_15790 [Alteromonadaceae bacterium]|nr:hypothetical protein [Alteromonadaceae bacterium]